MFCFVNVIFEKLIRHFRGDIGQAVWIPERGKGFIFFKLFF